MVNTEFNEEQFRAIYPEGIEAHYWTLARNRILRKEIEKSGFAHKKLLEIGCGRGVVVDFLRHTGINCVGVDLAPVEVSAPLNNFVYTGMDFRDLPVDVKNSIEGILLLDVIEHIEEPQVFLEQVRQSIPNAKICFVTVPARRELWSNYDSFNGHYRRYTIPTLKQTLGALEWRIQKIQYLFHTLYVLARSIVSIAGKRETTIRAPKGFLTIIHRMLAHFFVFDYLVFPKKVWGTSILCVAMLPQRTQ